MVVVAENTLKYFRTIKNFVRRLAESFRNQMFSELGQPRRLSEKLNSGWIHHDAPVSKLASPYTPVTIEIMMKTQSPVGVYRFTFMKV